MGFIDGHGRSFNPKTVTVIHHRGEADESAIEMRGLIQAKKGSFDVDAQVFEGDWVVVPDPRGGSRELYVSSVEIFDHGSQLDHLSAIWGKAPANATRRESAQSALHAPVINVYGDHAQVAFGNESVTQQSHVVTSGYTDLADTVRDVLSRLEDIDEHTRPLVVDSANVVLGELVKPEPDTSIVQRGLAQLRGVLAPIALATATGAGKELSEWAVDTIGKLVS
ncbi:hypothetical protein EDF63_1607 [Curtobacterium sp. JUb34]|uniref:hypothetical protein n=1 Tax=Curtobacterium sp. JUb34 TaxID=2485109 RepID=UPI000F46029A|nr:hypothetical protein [Curtobacterium sp. JUb34]ROR33202.1 hypothetical protein EDF63_1607 [Curtobacterium sp. JUb34]